MTCSQMFVSWLDLDQSQAVLRENIRVCVCVYAFAESKLYMYFYTNLHVFIMCTIQCALFLSFHYIYSANVLLLYLPYVLNYLWIHRAFLFFSFFPFSFIPKNQTCLTNHDLFKSCFDLPLFQSQASKLQLFWLNAVPSFFSERRSLEKTWRGEKHFSLQPGYKLVSNANNS